VARKIYLLDASAVIAGFTPGLVEEKQVTVPEVIGEARSLCSRSKLETAIDIGKLSVTEPSPSSMKKIKKLTAETGDKISATDAKLLALAVDLRQEGDDPFLVTDDYAIQNLAKLLEINYVRVAMPGISKTIRWEMACPACHRTYSANETLCKVCGSKLIRRPRKS
jgi:UPF0271 protein